MAPARGRVWPSTSSTGSGRSPGFVVPVFAFFSAGVTVGGLTGLGEALRDPIAVGIITGLVLGKAAGVFGSTFAVSQLTKAELDHDLAWVDVLRLSLLAGIGFTVSLLIGELAFGADSDHNEHVKVAVLTGSLFAAALAAVILLIRNSVYRRVHQAEIADTDDDGILALYQRKNSPLASACTALISALAAVDPSVAATARTAMPTLLAALTPAQQTIPTVIVWA